MQIENSKEEIKEKEKFKREDLKEIDIIIKKKTKKTSKTNEGVFRNNYKNYQYDYEEDFYEPY